jgi:hypothetical protein
VNFVRDQLQATLMFSGLRILNGSFVVLYACRATN